MKINTRLVFCCLCLGLLAACAGVPVGDYADNRPALVVPEFFDGSLTAYGIVKGRSGRVNRYFTASIDAAWVDGSGRLEEVFRFDDGETQRRTWKLVEDGQGNYIGTANDVVGDSTLRIAGNSLYLDYVLKVPYRDGSLELQVDDKMYLVSERVLINESVLSKFGIEVGQLTIVIVKNE